MTTKKPQLKPGDRFGAFRVERLLGSGGIGEVYEVTHKGGRYALKIIQSKWLDNEAQARRMMLEGQLLVCIRHPHVVDVLDTGITDEGIVWQRMELLHGATLREILQTEALLSLALGCAYLRQAALGAHQCHAIGAVHRDLKPENIFVMRPEEHVKILDLGLAKLLHGGTDTAEGQRLGTPLYMAPEQIRASRDITPATDVYALGVVGWEMFGGVHPFVEDPRSYDIFELYQKHFAEVPLHLSTIGLPAKLADVLACALAKHPRDRFPHGLAFARAVQLAWDEIVREQPEQDTHPGEPPLARVLTSSPHAYSFGTGPTEPSRAPRRSDPERRSSLPGRPVERASLQPLPRISGIIAKVIAPTEEATHARTSELPLAVGAPSEAEIHDDPRLTRPLGSNVVEITARRNPPLINTSPSQTIHARVTPPLGTRAPLAASPRVTPSLAEPTALAPELSRESSAPAPGAWVEIPDPVAAGISIEHAIHGRREITHAARIEPMPLPTVPRQVATAPRTAKPTSRLILGVTCLLACLLAALLLALMRG